MPPDQVTTSRENKCFPENLACTIEQRRKTFETFPITSGLDLLARLSGGVEGFRLQKLDPGARLATSNRLGRQREWIKPILIQVLRNEPVSTSYWKRELPL